MGLAPVAAFDTAAVTMRPFSLDVPPSPRHGSQGWNRTNGHLGQNQAGDHHHSGLRRASGRSRTCDLLLFREALSRLSY